MPTVASLKTELQTVQTQIQALYKALSIREQGAAGGEFEIKDPDRMLEVLLKRERQLMRRITAKQGGLFQMPQHVGLDVNKTTTDNG